ncbi:hypothetical protein TNCV_4399781 [Trichonephila clavipes]|nr:hypothetical protein TNCV_4399781 [Trichonephila clavipes]
MLQKQATGPQEFACLRASMSFNSTLAMTLTTRQPRSLKAIEVQSLPACWEVWRGGFPPLVARQPRVGLGLLKKPFSVCFRLPISTQFVLLVNLNHGQMTRSTPELIPHSSPCHAIDSGMPAQLSSPSLNRGSLGVIVVNSRLPLSSPCSTEDPPCHARHRHVKSVEAQSPPVDLVSVA